MASHSDTLRVEMVADWADVRLGIWISVSYFWGFPGGTSSKEPTCQCRRHRRGKSNPWVGKISWRRAWQPPEAQPWWIQEIRSVLQTGISLKRRERKEDMGKPGFSGTGPSLYFSGKLLYFKLYIEINAYKVMQGQQT